MRRIAAALGVLLMVAYPFAVYFGLSHWRPGVVGLVLVLLSAARLAVGAGLTPSRASLWAAAKPVLPVLVLSALAAVLDDHRFLLWLPVLVNVSLFVSFGFSLRAGGTPVIERFARLRGAPLGPEKVAWCRSVTVVWSAFFLANGGVSAVLAVSAPLTWWTFYCGFLVYLLIGALLGGEILLRRVRFPAKEGSP